MVNCNFCGQSPNDNSYCSEPSCSQCDPEIINMIAEYKTNMGAGCAHISIDPGASVSEVKLELLKMLLPYLTQVESDYAAIPEVFRLKDQNKQLEDLISQIAHHNCTDFQSLKNHVWGLTDIIAFSQETTVKRWKELNK